MASSVVEPGGTPSVQPESAECSDMSWTVTDTSKKAKKPRVEVDAHVVYIAGADINIAKINPLVIWESLTMKIGQVDRDYILGASLKVYCVTEDQKFKLLRSDNLCETNVTCSEPKIAMKSSKSDKEKLFKGVILGVF